MPVDLTDDDWLSKKSYSGSTERIPSSNNVNKAARAVESASRKRVITFPEAEQIAIKYGVDFGLVLGNLALEQSCTVDYEKGTIKCKR